MPSDTRTEDHDFTLQVQNRDEGVSVTSARALDERGFRIVVDGVETSFADFLGWDTEVVVRTGASARFVDESVMYTEDPRHSGGLIRQLERWNGGALESAFKRLASRRERARLRPNVSFAVISALVENILGLSLVLVVPALLGLRHAFVASDLLVAGLGAWLLFDLLGCTALSFIGLLRSGRFTGRKAHALGADTGGRRRPSWWIGAAARALLVAVPLQLLRAVNAVSYVAASSRTLPALARARAHDPSAVAAAAREPVRPAPRRPSITWERPAATVTPAVYARTAGTALVLALVAMTVFSSTALVASSAVRPDRSAWRLTYAAHRVAMEDHAVLPVAGIAGGTRGENHHIALVAAAAEEGAFDPAAAGGETLSDATARASGPTRALGPLAPLQVPAGLSPYCSPGLVAGATGEWRRVHGAGPAEYRPLSPWGVLVLARLAPLLSHLEEAASAYGIDADLLLRVILNESYLDPLAVGPTEDLGLAQVTSDSLTLLRSVSLEVGSRFYNPALMSGEFSVFDPAFSLCAGAAKLAWAAAEPGGSSEEVAYARYINPLVGVVRGQVADTHVAAVAAMTALTPLTELLGSTVAAYRADASSVTDEERQLLDVATAVGSGAIDLAEAYRRTAALVKTMHILDVDMYDQILERLYGDDPQPGLVAGTGTTEGGAGVGVVSAYRGGAAAGTILATVPLMNAASSSPSGP